MFLARLTRPGNQIAKRTGWLVFSSLWLLAACGGGGGAGGPSAPLQPPPGGGATGTPAALVTDQQIAAYAAGTVSWTGKSPVKSGTHQVTAVPMDYIEADDTNARYAWKQGWTGKGQTIAVIDDFNNSVTRGAKIAYRNLPIETSPSTREPASFFYEAPISHGALVAAIAGGQHQLIPEDSIIVAAGQPLSCADDPCFQGPVTLRNLSPSYGVAKDAIIDQISVNLSSRQNPTATLNDILKAVEKHHDKAAINLSLSGPVPASLTSFAAVANDFAGRGHITSKSEAVIVVALGNQNGLCRQTSMNSSKCNRIGVAFTHMDQLKDSTLLVGALHGKARASYSNQAGDLRAFTLFAEDTASFSGLNSAEQQGTSFAAPRVVGAAAIPRHKWPKQTAAQITRLLLDTASEDIDQDGTADFTGISEVFGYGRLDLKAALSPVGGLQ